MAFLPSRNILGPLRPFLQELYRFSAVPLAIPLIENEHFINYAEYMCRLGHLNAPRFPMIAMTEGVSPLRFFHDASYRCMTSDLLEIGKCTALGQPRANDHSNCECSFRRSRVKSNSTGFLMIDAFFAVNSLWSRIIHLANQRRGPVIIVDVANIVNSRETLGEIHKTILRSEEIFPGKEDILAHVGSHLDDEGLVDVGNRFACWRLLLCYFRMMRRLNGETEASFVFVSQGVVPGFSFREVDVGDALWINVSFLLAGRGMHHILGYNGSDDAVIIEISRRLIEFGYNSIVASDDSFSEFAGSIHRPPSRVAPVRLQRIRSLVPRRGAAPTIAVEIPLPPAPRQRRREDDDDTSPPARRRV